MEFARRRDVFGSKQILTKSYLQEKYPLDLTMYSEPPDERIAIDDVREMTLERLKLFRAFEIASAKVNKGIFFKDSVINEMTKQNLKYFMPLVKGYSDAEIRKKDYLSHYMLRLCYCQNVEYRKWFLARELEFFKIKFNNIDRKEDIEVFMKKNNLNYPPISEEEKKSILQDLVNSTSRYVNLDSVNIYKVHFTKVSDLVLRRKVFIKKGFAYVPQTELYSVLSTVFKKLLADELEYLAENLSLYDTDSRVKAIMKGLHTCYTGKDYCIKPSQSISRNDLDDLSVKSFPLCMKAMHETFKSTHHLKHQARLQYGLFLKGIGLNMEESLKFWKEGFTKKPEINVEVFDKQYAYAIRHSYGNEGKRANYTPYNCLKIINTSVAPGENHGCPFKQYDVNVLKKMLLNCQIPLVDITSISDYAVKGHYQLACTKYFEVVNNVTNVNGINHPNQFFEDSQNLIKESQSKRTNLNTNNVETAGKIEMTEWDDDFSLSNISNVID